MAILNAQLTTTQLNIFDPSGSSGVPAGKRYAITSVMVTNTFSPSDSDASSHTANFDMHFRKSGQALSSKVTCVVKELELPAGETFTFDSEKVILDAGEELSFVAGPDIGSGLTDLAVSVSYLEV